MNHVKNGSLSILGFEFWNLGSWLFDEYWSKFPFVKSFDVVYVFEIDRKWLAVSIIDDS